MGHKKVKSQKRRQSKTHRRTRHRSRSQKGGAWYNPFSWFGSSQTYVPEQEKSMVNRIGESISSGIQKVDDTLASASTSISQGATNIVNSTTDLLNKDVSLVAPVIQTPSQPTITYSPSAVGGKRHKRSLRHNKANRKTRSKATSKGGRGLGLTYYATPVSDIKIAEPTYLLNYEGGRKRKSSKK